MEFKLLTHFRHINNNKSSKIKRRKSFILFYLSRLKYLCSFNLYNVNLKKNLNGLFYINASIKVLLINVYFILIRFSNKIF